MPDEVGDGRPKLVVFAYDGLGAGETVDEVQKSHTHLISNRPTP